MSIIEIRASFQINQYGPLKFSMCKENIDEHLCPRKPHGHLWAGEELPIVLLPHLTNKTIALTILFDTLELLHGPGALDNHPGIEKVKKQIADSGLPDNDEEEIA